MFRRGCPERIDGTFAEQGVESGNQVIAALAPNLRSYCEGKKDVNIMRKFKFKNKTAERLPWLPC